MPSVDLRHVEMFDSGWTNVQYDQGSTFLSNAEKTTFGYNRTFSLKADVYECGSLCHVWNAKEIMPCIF